MGFISDYTSKKITSGVPGTERGTALWREVFGIVSKEDVNKFPRVRPDGYGRSIFSSDASVKRLVQALRSMAPGGWSDDRWEQSKHFTGAAYVAIDRIGRQLRRAEFALFRKDPSHPDGKRPVLESDPPEGNRQCTPYDLVKLMERPNPQDSFGDMMYRWCQQLRLTGTALTWMLPNMFHEPMELYVIPTALAIPQPAVNPDYPDGYYRIQPMYPYGPFSTYPTPATAVGAPIPAQWMMRFMYPHPLFRYEGYSPLTGLRQQLDQLETMDRSRWYKMKRGSNPDAVLNLDGFEGAQPLPDEEVQRIHAEWENDTAGAENHGKLIVGFPGGKFEPFGISPKEMDFVSSWEQVLSFILGGGFGITKPAAGMVEDSNYSTLFATLKQLYWITLEPDGEDIASKITRYLCPYFGDNLIFEIRMKPLDDHEVKRTKSEVLINAKAVTKNEIRKQWDEPPTKEEWGEEIAGEGAEEEAKVQQAEAQTEAIKEGKPPGEGNEEIEKERPTPGNLSRGALGGSAKSFYDRMRKVCVNGGLE